MSALQFLGTIGLFFATALSPLADAGWRLINGKIRREFPDVPRLTTAQLAAKLQAPNPPFLLDVRTAPEFAVSHLPGAIRVDPDAEARALSVPRDRALVTYCSVGYRSARFAQRLRAAGFSHVTNLEGSIFQWANENRPLVNEQNKEVAVVHPYNALWGKLLAPEHRAAPR